jgi:hypothetical protein
VEPGRESRGCDYNYPVSSPIQSEIQVPGAIAAGSQARPSVRAESTPWYVYTSLLATASAVFGLYWDISWHMSIGRDTFWTPAHLMIQFGAVLAGFSCAWLILRTTFGADAAARSATVGFWGFRGPLGAFIAAWGGFAMVTSAPFDNWWHNAYGLDVTIVSPPHTVLLLGMIGIQVGGLILVLGHMNRAEGSGRGHLERIFLATGGLILIQIAMFILEYGVLPRQHNAKFYLAASAAVPVVLVGIATAASSRWASTILATVYTVFWLAMLWIFPLFPASPKLGPVYQKVTHMIPLWFPLLLIFPAIAIDLLRWKIAGWRKWRQAALLGSVFLLVFVAAQWPFANFLQTPAARNWIFGADYFEYSTRPESFFVRHLFFPEEATRAEFWRNMALALFSALLSTRAGLAWGDWMRRIRR